MKTILIVLIFAACMLVDGIDAQVSNTTKMPVTVSIASFSLVDFAGTNKHTIFKSGNGAEQLITPSTLNTTWINYSAIVEGNSTNVISVFLSAKNLPAEVSIKLEVSDFAGAGAGKTGKSVGPIFLKNYPQDIIVDIGSCFTGRGIQNGHQLTYSWEWPTPLDLDDSAFEALEIAVTFTITSK
jgi:hypothetical protein